MIVIRSELIDDSDLPDVGCCDMFVIDGGQACGPLVFRRLREEGRDSGRFERYRKDGGEDGAFSGSDA